MGFIRKTFTIANPEGTRRREVPFLVETRSFYVDISSALAQELGLEMVGERNLVTADGREVRTPIVAVSVAVQGREALELAAILDTPEPLMGVRALEGLELAVDPTSGKLTPTRDYGIPLLSL